MTSRLTTSGSPPIVAAHADSAPADASLVQVTNLVAGYGAERILDGVSLNVPAGETLVVLGESGCGKTTLLKAIAGLIPILDGEILLDSQPVSRLAPRDRCVIYLDQEPLLFEHLTVMDNVGFALQLQGESRSAIRDAVEGMLTDIDLLPHAAKREWQLSGGQKQRVAFARAVLAKPRLLLLDEPFCSLDSKTRGQMQMLFRELSERHRLTCIFVTHDVKEALIVGHRFARMSRGALWSYVDRQAFVTDEQTGVPAEIAFWQQAADAEWQSALHPRESPAANDRRRSP